MRFRKKPITVEAFQMTRDVETIAPSWFMEAVMEGKVYINHSLVDGHALVYGCTIETPGGRLKARIGDYVVQGVDGELYPCKADIFRKTYERVQKGGGL